MSAPEVSMKNGLLIAPALIVALAASLVSTHSAPASRSADTCPVTISTRIPPPNAGFTAAGFNYGGRYLRASLGWPDGVLSAGRLPDGGYMATINADGSIRMKVGWWRGLRGTLLITGRRLDKPAPPLRADVPTGYGDFGFIPSGLTFPTVGCWKVVGKLQHARLAWVVKVRKVMRS
jgi:hypothetical protein